MAQEYAQAEYVLIDPAGRQVRLQGNEVIGGRHTDCQIRIADALASRRHFMLKRSSSGWQVCDLGSVNGTYVNGQPLQAHAFRDLEQGDAITVGSTTLRVQKVTSQAVDPGPAARPAYARSEASLASGAAGRSPAVESYRAPAIQAPQQIAEERSQAAAATPGWRWAVLGLGVLSLGLLATGVFSPWVQIQVQLAGAGQAIAGAASAAAGLIEGLWRSFSAAVPGIAPQPTPAAPGAATSNAALLTQTISGMDSHGYGVALLAVAAASAIALIIDLVLVSPRSAAFGIVYLLLGIAPAVMLIVDYSRFDPLVRNRFLFGRDLMELFALSQQFVSIQVNLLTGLYLVLGGLALLAVIGIIRIVGGSSIRERT